MWNRVILLWMVVCMNLYAYTVFPGPYRQPLVHYTADPVLQDSFVREFKLWNDATGGYFDLEPAGPGDEVDISVTKAAVMGQPNWLGSCSGNQITILWPLPPGYITDTVMLHEIGHALYLNHSTVQGSIMWPTIWPGQLPALSEDDVLGIEHLYGITHQCPLVIEDVGVGRTRKFRTTQPAEWDFGDGMTGTGAQLKHKFVANGTYEIKAAWPSLAHRLFYGTITITIGHKRNK